MATTPAEAADPKGSKAAAASPLTFPLALLDGSSRVYTALQLSTTPVRPGAPPHRPVTQTTVTAWTF